MDVPATDPVAVDADEPRLRVIPLGGLGEFGNNMLVYEIAGSAIIVDCGVKFPDAVTLGVDAVIPDMTWVEENRDKVVAIFLTHGHEDHIGAVPYLVEMIGVPIYGTRLTLGFVRSKLDEMDLVDRADLREIEPRGVVDAGLFTVEAIHVTHSIVDALAFAIRTPIGTIIHTGDFKFDPTPVGGAPTDYARLAALGEEGVLLLVSDSTNAVVSGYSRSERSVGHALDELFAGRNGRIVITTFASHIDRIQQIVDHAVKFRRKVFFIGRSMIGNVEIAERLGLLTVPREARPGAAKPSDLPDGDVVVVTTGTQGEARSALARMALGDHRDVELGDGDVVVFSSRTIPGNERSVGHVIDHICHRGADVIYDEMPEIHATGHACTEELKLMINLTRPRFFVPMHGTFRHLKRHAELARSLGIAPDRIFLLTNGMMAELDSQSGAVLDDRAPTGKVFVDQQFEEVADVVLRDRRHLAEDGFVIAIAALDLATGEIVRPPEIITRGLVYVDTSSEMLDEVRNLLTEVLREERPAEGEAIDVEILQDAMRAAVKRYFRKKMGRRPMILPVVWEM